MATRLDSAHQLGIHLEIGLESIRTLALES